MARRTDRLTPTPFPPLPPQAPHPYPHTLLKPEHAHHPHQGTWLPTASFEDEEGEGFDFDHKMSVLMEVDDRPGALHEVISACVCACTCMCMCISTIESTRLTD